MQDYDIFNLIRSKEIREYFRKNWKMNIEQKLSLIARSYVDISVKIDYLHHLAEQCSRKDRALVLNMIKYMELGYRSIIQPEASALYILHIQGYDGPNLEDEADFDLNDALCVYSNVIKLRILKHRFTIRASKEALFFCSLLKKYLTIRQFRAA